MAKKYDLEKVREAYDKAKRRAQAERYSYERLWFRNVLFYLGLQWINYSPQTRKWAPRKLAKWVPRPVTNKFASLANTIMQVLSAKEPDTRARPATDDPDDVSAAEVADRNFDVILKEVNSDEGRNIAAAWVVLTGNVILHPCYDPNPQHGTTFVQHLQCADCKKTFAPDDAGEGVDVPVAPPPGISTDLAAGQTGANGSAGPMPLPLGAPPQLAPEAPPPQTSEASCPECGSPNVGPAQEADGSPIGEDLPNGKMRLEVFSPFEVWMDLEARSMDEIQELLVRRRYPLDVIKERYGKPELESDNNSNVGGSIGLNLLRAIAYASGGGSAASGLASGRNVGDDQSITVDTLWKRPCPDFPQGLVATYANEQLLNEDEVGQGLPYHHRDGSPIWPWHLANFDKVPGRLFGRTRMDDVAPKQEQRNKLESLIQLIITRTANPVWLIPKNLGITEITGDPGQLIEGNWAMDPRLKPERVPGDNVPTSVIAWLEKIDKDMEEVAGVFDVLRGNAPPGVTAGTALRLLLERANTSFTPVIKRFEMVWQGVCQDLLEIFQEYATEERINKIQGAGHSWEVERFSKADLNGAVDVIVEAGSAVPKSQVGEQAMISDLQGMGVVNPQDPSTQYKILERFDSTGLLGDTDLNVRYAQRENWKFIKENTIPEINPIIDVHPVHITVHKQYALSSDYEKLPPQQQSEWMKHIIDHQMAMMPPPMMAPPPGATPPGQPQGNEASGSNQPSNSPAPQDNQQPPMPGGPM